VLTETVWALAHETPAVIPSRVRVVTTTVGTARLDAELLAPSAAFKGRSPWQALRERLLSRHTDGANLLVLDPVRTIAGPADATGRAYLLDDLRTPADNAMAADFILEQVRAITSNPDTRLVASIAGGRKTMGALLYAALTLVGRETDRLTHVLVNPPFDQRLEPPFFFPLQPPRRHLLASRDGSKSIHLSSRARIELADVPFVPLRNAFEDLHAPIGGFAGLVARYSRELRDLAEPPEIGFDEATHSVLFDGRAVALENPAQFAIIRLVFRLQDGLRANTIDFEAFAQIVLAAHGADFDLEELDRKPAAALAERVRITVPPHHVPPWTKGFEGHTVSRALSILRTRVQAVCPRWRPKPRTLLLPPFRLAGGD